jgi:hypothetical protein
MTLTSFSVHAPGRTTALMSRVVAALNLDALVTYTDCAGRFLGAAG